VARKRSRPTIAGQRALAALLAFLPAGCNKAPVAPRSPETASHASAHVTVSPTHGASADATPTPARSEAILEEWTLIMMSGQPAGRASLRVVEEKGKFLTSVEQSFRMSRMGVVIEAEMSVKVRETVEGELVDFVLDMNVAQNTVTLKARAEGGKLHMTSVTMGRERTKTLDWPEGALFGYAEERFFRSRKLTPGSKFSYWTYVPDLEKVAEITCEVGTVEEMDVLGQRVRATRIVKKGGAVPIIEYRDAEGIAWKTQMAMAGINMEILRTSREVALRETTRPMTFDVVNDLAVRVSAEIESPRKVTEATYRLWLEEGALDDLTLDGPGQKATPEADGTALLEVKAVRPRTGAPLGQASDRPDMRKYLEASTFAQSDDPAVIEVARHVTAGATSSLDAAKRLERWVATQVTNKGFGTGFATASEVMKNRAGDCSEHAVLLCALLRAAGIPSRGASGVVYAEFPGKGLAFWCHMWSEAWVGEWMPLDAAVYGSFVDASHIRLAEMDLAGMTPGADAVKLIGVLGGLEICVIDYTSRGRKHEVGPRTDLRDGHYRDLDEGVSFEVPGGWDLVRAGDSRLENKGAVAALLEREGKGRIVLISAPSGKQGLGEIVDRMGKRNAIAHKRSATLGGRPAVRVSYESDGERREGVAAIRGERFYLLRLGPATSAGVKTLDAVAASFRFE